MARVTYVKKAQQQFRMVPVIDPETGTQAVRIMKRKRPTKAGATESRVKVTREDRDQPLPPRTCDSCHQPIEVGTPYKWIQPKSGPYGGRRLNRHAACPTWNVWDYSSSLSARTAQIAHDFWTAFDAGMESQDDVTSALEDAASEIESLAEEKREGASNIEDGFGHPTQQSEELEDIATQLDDWAQEVRDADIPETPDQCEECSGDGKTQCETCSGDGDIEPEPGTGDERTPCADCEGNGEVDCEACEGSGEPGDDQMDAWRDEARDACSIVDESPV
jgi:hypothetical protein